MKKCGYSFWGYLGDVKFTKDGFIASTSDGNAFYSWCIIREFQKRGYEVMQMMPDRDIVGYEKYGDRIFSSWAGLERTLAYTNTKKINWWDIIDDCRKDISYHKFNTIILKEYIKSRILNRLELYGDLEFILHEYRMLIPGRNDYDSIFNIDWQPDYLIQECIFDYCCKEHKKLILFDLDYKLDYRAYEDLKSKGCQVKIFELGKRWQVAYGGLKNISDIKKVYIPFDFDKINYFDIPDVEERKNNLVYVGNRYERDWCIDKYMPVNLENCMIYGNWLENGRDSMDRWSYLNFGNRLQTLDMPKVYQNTISTILFAKREYCTFEFMTARIIEAVFYGTVPLFIEEYGEKVIKEYAGNCKEFLTVSSKKDVEEKVYNLRYNSNGAWIKECIEYLREYLKFMDVKNFVDTIEEVK